MPDFLDTLFYRVYCKSWDQMTQEQEQTRIYSRSRKTPCMFPGIGVTHSTVVLGHFVYLFLCFFVLLFYISVHFPVVFHLQGVQWDTDSGSMKHITYYDVARLTLS